MSQFPLYAKGSEQSKEVIRLALIRDFHTRFLCPLAGSGQWKGPCTSYAHRGLEVTTAISSKAHFSLGSLSQILGAPLGRVAGAGEPKQISSPCRASMTLVPTSPGNGRSETRGWGGRPYTKLSQEPGLAYSNL